MRFRWWAMRRSPRDPARRERALAAGVLARCAALIAVEFMQLDRQAYPDHKEYTLRLHPVVLVNERMAVPDAGMPTCHSA
jgi:hypothetical protein